MKNLIKEVNNHCDLFRISKFVINEFDDLDVIAANECICENRYAKYH